MTNERFSFGHRPLFKPDLRESEAVSGPAVSEINARTETAPSDFVSLRDRTQTTLCDDQTRTQAPTQAPTQSQASETSQVEKSRPPRKSAAQKQLLAQALGQALAAPTPAASPQVQTPSQAPAPVSTASALQNTQPAKIQPPSATPSKSKAPKSTAPKSTGPAKNGSLKRRVAALLAVITVIAVPAMAAPEDFGQLPGGAPTEAELVREALKAELARNPAMPFERPGMSFPGSAFFFLAEPPKDALIALPTTDALALDVGLEVGEAGREVGALIDAGPGARPFFGAGGASQTRASDCLAQAIWYEAASESEAGQRAVAQVVLNRVSHSSWPASVCGVVYQGSNRRTGCQFTFTCDGSLRRKASGSTWQRAQNIAREALSGSVYEPIGHATHYHTLWINPYWASSLDHVGTIGAHRFYRNRGTNGQRSAFTQSYTGKEPGVRERVNAGPAPITASAIPALPGASSVGSSASNGYASPTATPSASAQARVRSGARDATRTAALTGPGSVRSNQSVSGAGQVRDDYASAGQWKSDAARTAMQEEARRRAQEAAQTGTRDSGPASSGPESSRPANGEVSGQETPAPR